jgi:protein disulfide-isomerase A6
MKSILFLLLAFQANLFYSFAKTVELNDANFDKVTPGKQLFLRFMTKSCSLCIEMEPAWKELEEAWETNNNILIGTIDCAKNESLCTQHKVQGTPTLLYGDRNSLSEYTAENGFSMLNQWVKVFLLKPICSPDNIQACKGLEKKRMNKYMKMSEEELKQIIADEHQKEKDVEISRENELAKMSAYYETTNNAHVIARAEMKSNLKILKGVLQMRHS